MFGCFVWPNIQEIDRPQARHGVTVPSKLRTQDRKTQPMGSVVLAIPFVLSLEGWPLQWPMDGHMED